MVKSDRFYNYKIFEITPHSLSFQKGETHNAVKFQLQHWAHMFVKG